MKIGTTLIVFFSLLLFSLHLSSISAQEVEDEREFDYREGSEKGPRHWGKIKKEWEACNNGVLQSPIDLSSQRVKIVPKFGDVKRSYKPCNATVKNRGHDISIYWVGKAGSIKVNGVVYDLQQAHWHSPSEHSINGRRYDMELHMVHQSSDPNGKNKIAVVGQLYTIGKPDPFLAQFSKQISYMIDREHEMGIGEIDPADIKFGGKKYYKYLGSLTVPPCSEGVIWVINKKIRTVSKEQVRLLREAVHDYAERNARPLQPLNNREVQVLSTSQRSRT
ncbi:alpha carbonic anhydrase 7-like [Cucurbita pepo subsp. pepo]|uniref:alpha carbonic anhydrase 7-like n=1 Tax=Cucurbita pepo subsp. pepo TaxID=3664 RepID=UPI000C9D374B|nr:alpha carbonic anhydrase 7-like [Cucurbita pepo subsp. pepo]